MTLLDLPQVPLTLTHARCDYGDVLAVVGYLDTFTVPTLQPALLAALETQDHPKAGSLTLDLSCVRFIDRAGLELLLHIREKVSAEERTLAIRLRPGSQPESMLQSGRLECLLTS